MLTLMNLAALGIFGKNYSGKSSIVDGVLWTLLTQPRKMSARISMLLTRIRNTAEKVEIQIGDRTFTVERTAKKYTKRLKDRNARRRPILTSRCLTQ